MRRLACSLALVLLASAPAALAAAPAASPASPVSPAPAKAKAGPRKIDKSPAKAVALREVHITCDAAEVLGGQKQASCKGNVVIVREDMKVRCHSLLTDYDDQRRPRKLSCAGKAHMRQAARGERPEREVWGELAVFDNETGVLTVTGAPHAREGPNTMQGEKILFDTSADKLRVERATMVIQTPAGEDPLAPRQRPAGDAGAQERAP